jgi:5-methyltetrahydropteroyltriglutamate--homocysteine methyltransferase
MVSAQPRSSIEARPPFRADHVGSFLRPKYLLDARDQHAEGAISPEALREVEDRAIREIVSFQQDLGLHGITDGEFRRTYFHLDFLKQFDGVVEKGVLPVKFHKVGGDIDFAPPVMHVTDRVRRSRPIQRRDFEFLKSVTTQTAKVTIPSPTMLHFRGGRAGISQLAYPDLERFYEDVASAYVQEIADLAAAGCTYLQLDDTNLAYLCDPAQRAAARKRGDDPDALPLRYARLINAAIAGHPPQMSISIHLCRGNFKSSWAAEGGYEPVARVLFNELDVDGYFLEYDDARSGDFEPLRHVPRGKSVVLGLVGTKLNELETMDELRKRIEQAERYLPLEQICLSPQCGFSSTVHGNDVAVSMQAKKIKLVVDTARAIWGYR